ncbi:MAG: hypothetical protein HDP34_06250 [Clostridia bacterium]|nr:hypothetical protein [Clostridia bacterium]
MSDYPINIKNKIGTDDSIKKVYSLLIVVYPILNRYASFLPMLTLSETFLLFFLIYVVIKKKIHFQTVYLPFVLYLIFLVFHYISQNTNGEAASDNIGTMLRLIYLYSSIILVGRGFLDGQKAVKWLNIAAILMVCYCILQTLAAKFGIYLTTYIPGLPIMAEDRDEFILMQQQKYGLTYRAYGLLNEPSLLCVYLILPLAINLFSNLNIKSRIKKAAFISLGCFICMSSTGIIVCSAVWMMYIFINKSREAKRYRKYVIWMVLIAIIVIPNTILWETFMERTFGGSISEASLEHTTRFNALDMLNIIFNNSTDFLIGVGMETTVFYLPGFLRVFYTMGMIGLIIVFFMFINIYRKGDPCQKKLMFIYIILNIGTEILLGNFAIYYLAFINAEKKEIY